MFASILKTQRSERFVGMLASGRNHLGQNSWLPTVTIEGCKPVDGYLPAASPVGVPSS